MKIPMGLNWDIDTYLLEGHFRAKRGHSDIFGCNIGIYLAFHYRELFNNVGIANRG